MSNVGEKGEENRQSEKKGGRETKKYEGKNTNKSVDRNHSAQLATIRINEIGAYA